MKKVSLIILACEHPHLRLRLEVGASQVVCRLGLDCMQNNPEVTQVYWAIPIVTAVAKVLLFYVLCI